MLESNLSIPQRIEKDENGNTIEIVETIVEKEVIVEKPVDRIIEKAVPVVQKEITERIIQNPDIFRQDINFIRDEISSLKRHIEGKVERIAESSANITYLKDHIANLSGKVDDLSKKPDIIKPYLDKINSEFEAIKREVQGMVSDNKLLDSVKKEMDIFDRRNTEVSVTLLNDARIVKEKLDLLNTIVSKNLNELVSNVKLQIQELLSHYVHSKTDIQESLRKSEKLHMDIAKEADTKLVSLLSEIDKYKKEFESVRGYVKQGFDEINFSLKKIVSDSFHERLSSTEERIHKNTILIEQRVQKNLLDMERKLESETKYLKEVVKGEMNQLTGFKKDITKGFEGIEDIVDDYLGKYKVEFSISLSKIQENIKLYFEDIVTEMQEAISNNETELLKRNKKIVVQYKEDLPDPSANNDRTAIVLKNRKFRGRGQYISHSGEWVKIS